MKRGTVTSNPFAELPMPSSITKRERVLSDEEASAIWARGARSPPPLWCHRPSIDADRSAARGSGWDDVGRTFGRFGDLDDTSHANQKWDSACRAVKPASARTPPALRSDRPEGIQHTLQDPRTKLALVFPGERGTPFSGWSKAKSALDIELRCFRVVAARSAPDARDRAAASRCASRGH